MVLLEGKPIAQEIRNKIRTELEGKGAIYRLGIIVVGSDSASEQFVRMKKKFGVDVGIDTRIYTFSDSITTNELRKQMKDIVHEPKNTGVIVQLPLPKHIDTQAILNAIVPEKDVDMLSARAVGDFHVGKARILPPVVSAVEQLFRHYSIALDGKNVAIIGYGRLVGQPLSIWCMQQGALVTPISNPKNFDSDITQKADVIISGIGEPQFLIGDYVKDGVTIVDVGTSEAAGRVVGDVHFESVKAKAAYITPVPGGVGPLTVACLFQNLVTLASQK